MVTVREASVETIALVFPSLLSNPESLCKPFKRDSPRFSLLQVASRTSDVRAVPD